MRQRRRAARQGVGLPGTCVVEGESSVGADCDVIDISVAGMGVEILGPVPNGLVGRRLAIDVPMPARDAVTMRLVGQVRNVRPGRNGGVRVGLAFTDLSQTVRTILDALELAQAAS